MDLAFRLAGNAVTRQFGDLSPQTVETTVNALIDSLACALAGTNAPGMAQARGALARWGSSGSTVWGGFGQAPAPTAAFLNAGSLGALDYDDTDDKVPLHANSVVLPALIADVEDSRPDCDGREFLTALAVGLDGAMRIGRAGGPKGTRGWNYSVVAGCMGAILGIARLRRWDTDTAVSALGHQFAQAAGGLQPILDARLGMRCLPGFMAKDVLLSAALAQANVEGANNVFDGRAGFINQFQGGQFDREAVVAGLEQCAMVGDLSLKPYPACRFTHAAIDLALQLHQRSLRPQDIGLIRILVTKQTLNMVGRRFESLTASVLDAQFSLPYTVAVAIERGAFRVSDLRDTAIREARTGAFAAEKIVVELNPDVPNVGLLPVRFEVRLTDGRRIELDAQQVSGSAEKPMTAAQFRSKVVDCLDYNQSRVAADELIAAVQALRSGAPVSCVIKLLA